LAVSLPRVLGRISLRRALFGAVAGAALSAAVTGCLVPFRDKLADANVVLGFVLVVLTAAWIGGRLSGAITGVMAALCFNVFFTEPYNSLRISKGQDVASDLLLLVVALAFALVRERESAASREATTSRDEIADLFLMARAVGAGEGSVRRLAGIVGNMCSAEGVAVSDPSGEILAAWGSVPSHVDVDLLHRVSINGWPPEGPRVIPLDAGQIPVGGALVPVWFANREVGHLAVFPGSDPVRLTRETTRAVAVAATLTGSLLQGSGLQG
jgi:hypothetical protein